MFARAFTKSYQTVSRRFFCNAQTVDPNEELKARILKTALIHVNRAGWTDKALSEACMDLGYPAVTSRIVSNGPIDLVYYAVDRWNERLAEDLSYLELEEMRISDRIIEGIKIRLSYQIPYLTRWNEALALGGLPNNAPKTLEKLTYIADEIWYIAGDRSADLNWYTKRGLLMSAYVSTELFMLTDKSENYIETWRFLDRRIRDILEYGKYINIVRNVASGLNVGLSSLAAMASLPPRQYDNDIEKFRSGPFYNKTNSNTTVNTQPPIVPNETQNILDEVSKFKHYG